MVRLNRDAAAAMQEVGVHACTDITGFGLLGHLREMLVASGVIDSFVAGMTQIAGGPTGFVLNTPMSPLATASGAYWS